MLKPRDLIFMLPSGIRSNVLLLFLCIIFFDFCVLSVVVCDVYNGETDIHGLDSVLTHISFVCHVVIGLVIFYGYCGVGILESDKKTIHYASCGLILSIIVIVLWVFLFIGGM